MTSRDGLSYESQEASRPIYLFCHPPVLCSALFLTDLSEEKSTKEPLWVPPAQGRTSAVVRLYQQKLPLPSVERSIGLLPLLALESLSIPRTRSSCVSFSQCGGWSKRVLYPLFVLLAPALW